MGTELNNEHALRGHAPSAALRASLGSALASISEHGAILPIALLIAAAVTIRLGYTVDHDVAW
jgi:uncharacterized membrane protein SpoIIM required for sporulation